MFDNAGINVSIIIGIVLLGALLLFLKSRNAKFHTILLAAVSGVIIISLTFSSYFAIAWTLSNSPKKLKMKDLKEAEQMLEHV